MKKTFNKKLKELSLLEKWQSDVKIKLKGEYTVYYGEEDLEYFTRYLGINSIRIEYE